MRDESAHALQTALDGIARTQGTDDLDRVLRAVRHDYGLARIVYHATRLPQHQVDNPILILTYDRDWIGRYVERDYFRIDPIVRTGLRGFLPLDWSTVDRDTPEARAFFREADAFGVGRQGVTLPVRGPAGERALFTVTANLSEREWRARRLHLIRDFQVIAHFVHDRAVDLSGHRVGRPVLSSREAQCLSMIAEGRQPKQIASTLRLSPTAVHLYLTSAKTKLNSATLAEAAVKAAALEIIVPPG